MACSSSPRLLSTILGNRLALSAKPLLVRSGAPGTRRMAYQATRTLCNLVDILFDRSEIDDLRSFAHASPVMFDLSYSPVLLHALDAAGKELNASFHVPPHLVHSRLLTHLARAVTAQDRGHDAGGKVH